MYFWIIFGVCGVMLSSCIVWEIFKSFLYTRARERKFATQLICARERLIEAKNDLRIYVHYYVLEGSRVIDGATEEVLRRQDGEYSELLAVVQKDLLTDYHYPQESIESKKLLSFQCKRLQNELERFNPIFLTGQTVNK